MEKLPKDTVAEAIVVQVEDFGVKIHRHIVLLGQSSCQCVPVRPLIYIHTCIAGILCSAEVLAAISSKVHGGLPCIVSLPPYVTGPFGLDYRTWPADPASPEIGHPHERTYQSTGADLSRQRRDVLMSCMIFPCIMSGLKRWEHNSPIT